MSSEIFAFELVVLRFRPTSGYFIPRGSASLFIDFGQFFYELGVLRFRLSYGYFVFDLAVHRFPRVRVLGSL